MTQRCQVTGAVPRMGRNVSHSQRRTPRRFSPNIQSKRYFVPSLGRTVRLRVSARGIRIIDQRGIESVVAEIRSRGERV
ncbi:50S ribosomal protein L28 [Brachybacterium endophyticum]|uniref:Large ribosomal subunit protein bL28 n=1 Tax=Brachybacterium endophyticum TaxID=2182385 RepID=A0A2U2RNW6_9MICO|nr:50S ribosomal protein L28 [Brachybacterium endophyticum]PWH07454.1 50S ribosomal protein L28 [Brachybacterium endophyticum]